MRECTIEDTKLISPNEFNHCHGAIAKTKRDVHRVPLNPPPTSASHPPEPLRYEYASWASAHAWGHQQPILCRVVCVGRRADGSWYELTDLICYFGCSTVMLLPVLKLAVSSTTTYIYIICSPGRVKHGWARANSKQKGHRMTHLFIIPSMILIYLCCARAFMSVQFGCFICWYQHGTNMAPGWDVLHDMSYDMNASDIASREWTGGPGVNWRPSSTLHLGFASRL